MESDESIQEFTKREKREMKKQLKEDEKKKEKRTRLGKNLLVLLGIVGVIVAVGYGLMTLSDPDTSFAPTLSLPVEEVDHVKGNKEASVTLVEYGDYECPGCAAYAPLVAQAASNHPDDLKVVYRHFPLPNHTNSLPASYAAEAAGKQGKFWEMNDLLFLQRNDWMTATDLRAKFEEYAKTLELDIEKFKQDMDSQEVKDKVQRDLSSGEASGVNATPTFFINGEKVERLPGNAEAFFNLIEREINEAKSM